MSDELLPWFDQAKEKVVSCENKHSATGNYHPLVEGKKILSQMVKKSLRSIQKVQLNFFRCWRLL